MNNNIKMLIFAVVFIAAGAVLVFLGIKNNSEIKKFPEVSVTVLAVEVTYEDDTDGGQTRTEKVYVEYTIDGKEYTDILLNSAPSNLSKGDVVTAHYNPEKPEYVTGATKNTGYLLMAFGLVFALTSGGSVIFRILRGR